MPRPGFDPTTTGVRYIQKVAKDGAQLVVFPEYPLGRISVPSPQTEWISKAAAASRIYVIVLKQVRNARKNSRNLQQRRPEVYGEIVKPVGTSRRPSVGK